MNFALARFIIPCLLSFVVGVALASALGGFAVAKARKDVADALNVIIKTKDDKIKEYNDSIILSRTISKQLQLDKEMLSLSNKKLNEALKREVNRPCLSADVVGVLNKAGRTDMPDDGNTTSSPSVKGNTEHYAGSEELALWIKEVVDEYAICRQTIIRYNESVGK